MTLHEENAREFGFTPHEWDYGDGFAAIRQCRICKERETAWDDEDYPINPCPGVTVQ